MAPVAGAVVVVAAAGAKLPSVVVKNKVTAVAVSAAVASVTAANAAHAMAATDVVTRRQRTANTGSILRLLVRCRVRVSRGHEHHGPGEQDE